MINSRVFPGFQGFSGVAGHPGQVHLKHLFGPKEVEYIRVDGASDEGPSHVEVQFLWTERHFLKNTLVTMVSSRCSGDSYLNRVELQNSHLSKGHSNTFIPSTLVGAHAEAETGKKLVIGWCPRKIF